MLPHEASASPPWAGRTGRSFAGAVCPGVLDPKTSRHRRNQAPVPLAWLQEHVNLLLFVVEARRQVSKLPWPPDSALFMFVISRRPWAGPSALFVLAPLLPPMPILLVVWLPLTAWWFTLLHIRQSSCISALLVEVSLPLRCCAHVVVVDRVGWKRANRYRRGSYVPPFFLGSFLGPGRYCRRAILGLSPPVLPPFEGPSRRSRAGSFSGKNYITLLEFCQEGW